MFIFFFIYMFLLNTLFVVPMIPEYTPVSYHIMDALNYILWAVVTLSFVLTSCRNPGRLEKKMDD